MFTNADILLDLARQHQSELIGQARQASLVRRVGRAARQRRRRPATPAGDRDSSWIARPKPSSVAGSLVACEVPEAEPVR
jgi:hypothetical protein